MDILIKTAIISFINNKDQRGDSFRADEKKVKRAAIEWDNFVLQEQLKSLICVDRSLHGDPMKDKLIYELNFKNCVRLS